MGQVYRIINKLNGFQYVGATKHTGKQRFREHVNNSKHPERNTFQNLAKAIAEFGAENFELVVMIDNVSDDRLYEAEKFCFRMLKKRYTDFYNMTECGKGVTGFKHTAEDIKKMSEASKGNSYASCMTEKKCEMYISRAHNINWRKNLSAAKKRFPTAVISNPMSEESKKLMQLNKNRKIHQYSLNFDYIASFENLSKAGKRVCDLGLCISDKYSASYVISLCCRGKLKTAYGYIWKFEGVETN